MNYDIQITYGEIVYKEVVDFTPGDGSCALTHIRNKHAYVGVCFNDFHVEVLHKFLTTWPTTRVTGNGVNLSNR